MDRVEADKARDLKVTVWKKYEEIAAKAEGKEVGTWTGKVALERPPPPPPPSNQLRPSA